MDDDALKKLFEGAEPGVARPEARDRAMTDALAAFDDEKISPIHQGSGDMDRPTENTDENQRSSRMTAVAHNRWITRPWTSGFATAAVVVVAVFIANNTYIRTDTGERRTLLDEGLLVATESPAERTARETQEVQDSATRQLRAFDEKRNTQGALGLTDNRTMEEFIAAEPNPDVQAAMRTAAPKVLAESPYPNPGDVTIEKSRASERSDIRRELRAIEESMIAAPAEMPLLAQQAAPSFLAAPRQAPVRAPVVDREEFQHFDTNPVKLTREDPVSTFSIDVDTAAYSYVRKQLMAGSLPRADAVRLEEMVNYFSYDYPAADSMETPFSTSVNVIDSPWRAGNKLVHIGIRGYEKPMSALPRSNLVFLLDVSGSMNRPNKLPLVKQALTMLVNQLRGDDTISIVVYAGAAGTVLPPTPVSRKAEIIAALDQLQAGGSTAGGEGIRLAYQMAQSAFVEDGVNRIFLATDGDFNVGITDPEALKNFVENRREDGVFLTVLGFGDGNYQSKRLQMLSQNGNGVAMYIDTLSEARKALVEEAAATLFTIAKDVKIQVEFNPATVAEYRLLGYETRALRREDFNNDRIDAGEIGAGHTVTAIYEITPVGAGSNLVSPSRYQTDSAADLADLSDEYGFLRLRYKQPDSDTSQLIEQPILLDRTANGIDLREARFATAVAGFAQLLRGGEYTGQWTYDDALALALENRGNDEFGYRAEFTQMIRMAMAAAPGQR